MGCLLYLCSIRDVSCEATGGFQCKNRQRARWLPDDIKEINAADGLLTALGGVTSHASVVAHRLGKTCVVGCGNIICDEIQRAIKFDQIQIQAEDHISIDGREGSVCQGYLKVKAMDGGMAACTAATPNPLSRR